MDEDRGGRDDEAPAGARRALLADDDEFFRLALTSILTGHLGIGEVVAVRSLDEAVARLGSDPSFAIALFDLEMPGMAGAASLAAVRECHPRLRLAVVTASQARKDVLQALEAGVHGFISKGCGVNALREAIARILDGQVVVPDWLATPPAAGVPRLVASAEPAAARLGKPTTALTPRQLDVLRLVVDGKSNKEIARALQLAEGTVKIHVAALLRAFDAPTRAGVAAIAARLQDGP